MNLNAAVGNIIAAVNPTVPATLLISTGPGVTQPDGSRAPTYAAPMAITAQIQPMTYKDIQQVDGLNLQGTRVSIYVNGQVDGLVRATNQGGDLITVASGPYAGTWLVAMVLEKWQDWTKVA